LSSGVQMCNWMLFY